MAGKVVTLTVYYSIIEAKICISMLQAHGIYAFVGARAVATGAAIVAALGMTGIALAPSPRS